MKKILSSIEAEYRRYKALADAAMAQLTEAQLNDQDPAVGNSVAIVAWHIAGNLRSRFTEFLALGRKNYLFAGSHEAAQRAAVIYSLVAICKKRDVQPHTSLPTSSTAYRRTRIGSCTRCYPIGGRAVR